jgi:homocitrate synthase NifV
MSGTDFTASVDMRRDVLLEDSTLREGEQSPGVCFSLAEKVTIARLLCEIGVEAIEVGTPVMGGPEGDAIEALVAAGLPVRLIGWNRGRRSDLEASFACGLTAVHIGLPSSDHHIERAFKSTRAWVIEAIQELVGFAKEQGAWVSVSAEDVGRADLDFLEEYAKHVEQAGADRMRLSDTIGVLDPVRAEELFARLSSAVDIPLQAHMHNDIGLATANTLAAVRGGARQVHVTVNGLGERAGIAPIDEVVIGLERHLDVDPGIETSGLTRLARYVAEASGRPLPVNKPVTGSAIFTHESGIHVSGTLKAADAFEPFPAESVGGKTKFVIGKHSGRDAVQHLLAEGGIEAERQDLGPVTEAIRFEAVRRKRSLDPQEAIAIYQRVTEG